MGLFHFVREAREQKCEHCTLGIWWIKLLDVADTYTVIILRMGNVRFLDSNFYPRDYWDIISNSYLIEICWFRLFFSLSECSTFEIGSSILLAKKKMQLPKSLCSKVSRQAIIILVPFCVCVLRQRASEWASIDINSTKLIMRRRKIVRVVPGKSYSWCCRLFI